MSGLVAVAFSTVVAACEIQEDLSSLTNPSDAKASSDTVFESEVHLREGRYGLALEKFKVLLADAPGSVRVLNAVGTAYDKLDRGDVAERYYRRALEREPDSLQTLNNFGYSLILRGRHEEALPFLWKAAKSVGPDGRSLVAVRNYKAALKKLELATGPRLEKASLGGVSRKLKKAEPKSCQVGPVWLEKSGERVYSLITNPTIEATAAIKKLSGSYNIVDASGVIQQGQNCGSIIRAAYGVMPRVSFSQSQPEGAVRHLITEMPEWDYGEVPSGAGDTKSKDADVRSVVAPVKSDVAAAESASVELSNGAGRDFLARRLSSYFGTKGLSVDRLTNAKHFSHEVTTIFYRKGFLEEAKRYNNELPFKVELKEGATSKADVRIRLGRDILEFDKASLMNIDNKLSLLLDSWT
jgi:hypothetical protein